MNDTTAPPASTVTFRDWLRERRGVDLLDPALPSLYVAEIAHTPTGNL